MFSFGGRNRVVSIAIEDYCIRMVESNGKDLSSIKIIKEKEIPQNMIKRGKVVDELAFFEFLKTLVTEWNIKNRKVHFYAPHDLVIMRNIDIPEDVRRDEIKQYITMEIGHTIHFPFTHPVFDIYNLANTSHVDEVTVIAASEEEIQKYMNIFADAQLTPIAVDIHSLGTYRYVVATAEEAIAKDVSLFIEFNLSAVNISIFHNHTLEFLRYQPLNTEREDWELAEEETFQWTYTGDEQDLQSEINDQINDIARLMNFYQFTLQQGEKAVDRLFILGDHPRLDHIKERLDEQYEQSIERLQIKNVEENIPARFIPLLGLALKGVK